MNQPYSFYATEQCRILDLWSLRLWFSTFSEHLRIFQRRWKIHLHSQTGFHSHSMVCRCRPEVSTAKLRAMVIKMNSTASACSLTSSVSSSPKHRWCRAVTNTNPNSKTQSRAARLPPFLPHSQGLLFADNK